LFDAWTKFRRGKRSRPDVLEYEHQLEPNIFELHEQFISGTYYHGSYEPFTICDPKQRLIHKATVKDRLVHQAIVSAIEPNFERQFIYDSYSCRKGKGTHKAVQRFVYFLRKASRNNTRTVYVLKCDIKQFFASVDHALLFELLQKHVADEQTLNLLHRIVDSYNITPGKGIPLGNLTSQLFANVYLHQLDWFVKQTLGAKHYIRYCDDFVIVSEDRAWLVEVVEKLQEFVGEQLYMQLHPNKVSIQSWEQGVDFLGYIVKPTCILLRGKTRKRMLKRVNTKSLTSYTGLCEHGNCYELEQLLITVANG